MARLTLSQAGRGPSGPLRTLVILACVSVVLVTVYFREGTSGPVHMLRSGVQTIATPFTAVGARIVQPFAALGNAVRNATADSKSLSDLEASNAELTQQLAQMDEYREENARLESLLGLTSSYAMSGVGARVIGYSSDSWTSTATIDKGSADGVAVDEPVVDGTGVVGQVTSVAANSATVRLLADPSTGVSAVVQSSGATGILTGSVDGTLRLRYVSSQFEVSVGDVVVTSGLGGVYPRGLALGTVASCTSTASGQYYEITVRPAVSTQAYDEVFAVSSFDAAEVASTGASDASASADASAGTDASADAGAAQDAGNEAAGAPADGTDADADAGDGEPAGEGEGA